MRNLLQDNPPMPLGGIKWGFAQKASHFFFPQARLLRLPQADRLAFPLNLSTEARIDMFEDRELFPSDNIPGHAAPRDELKIRARHRSRETRRLRLSELPEPFPKEGAVVWHLRFWAFDLKALVALAPGLAILVLDAVVARDNRYGFAEPFAKLFVKFARSSEAVATWS